jgi:glycosyltransferase involved in cell wall biosynthesis
MSVPAVTVVVAAHNAAAFIEDTLASALAQTWREFELIVVDDGSSDGTRDRIARCGDPRVTLVAQPHAGAAAALNAALSMARGTYVAIMDHDDLWAAGKLQRHVEFMSAAPLVDLTFSWSRLISAKGRPLSLHSQRHVGSIDFRGLLADFVIGPTSSVVLRRSVLERTGFCDPALGRYYDMDLILRIALVRERNIHAIPAELAFYRRHDGQLSGDWRGMREDWRRLLARARTLAPDDTAAVEKLADANMHRYFAFLAYERRDYRASLDLLRDALRRSHRLAFNPRAAQLAAACLAGMILPAAAHEWLESIAGIRGYDTVERRHGSQLSA